MITPLEKVFKPIDYVGLSVEKSSIAEFVRAAAKENSLFEKSEFHISVLVAKNARVAWRAVAARQDSAGARDLIESLFTNLAWQYTLTAEYFLHEHSYTKEELIEQGDIDIPAHTRRSIVQKVELPDLIPFYQKINNQLNISLPTPVPHITLFAWSDYEPYKTRGIGICSREEFERFTRKVIT